MVKYGVSTHATERAVERLNIPREHAAHHLNQLMETAVEIDHTGNGVAFEHPKTKTRLIVDKDKKMIITIYPHEHDDRVPRAAMISDFYLLNSLLDSFNHRYGLLMGDLTGLEMKRAEKTLEQVSLKSSILSAVTDLKKGAYKAEYKFVSDELLHLNREIALLTSKIQRMSNEISKITATPIKNPFTELEEFF